MGVDVSSSEPLLSVQGLSASWGSTPVLRSVSFALHDKEFLVLLGPNGSGKTTLLRCLAGLERPTAGRIALAGQEVGDFPTYRRGIVLMQQEAALFPHRTVYENIAYAPLLQRRSRPAVEEEVDRLVGLLGLPGFEDRYPDQLSGGERQRVALARTLAARPKVVLLDEPFAAIDVEVRAELHADFRRVLRLSDTAAIHVTHDRAEGLFLGDRVGLLFDGVLEELGSPQDVHDRPRSERTARFLGYSVLPGPEGPVALHPSELQWEAGGGSGLSATVLSSGTTGRKILLVVRTDAGVRVELELPLGASPLPGSRGTIRWDPRRGRTLPRGLPS